ncbi:molybdopterin dinucleotide binding domain-containing protein, partial [Acinetobacter baumannii]|uniref:molybdopterin dinucleotide binding domain-containing protein n=1 Tax=Acinetobacter baumannii TaxID=470 RepID=UPI001C0A3680
YAPLAGHVEPADSPLASTPDGRFPYVITTAKSGWFIHSSHRHVASLRRKSPNPGVEISPALAERRCLVQGDWATVETPTGEAS